MGDLLRCKYLTMHKVQMQADAILKKVTVWFVHPYRKIIQVNVWFVPLYGEIIQVIVWFVYLYEKIIHDYLPV